MAVVTKENVALWALFVPVGITVNAVFLWGVRDIINLKNPLFWAFEIVVHVWLYRTGTRNDPSHARPPANTSR